MIRDLVLVAGIALGCALVTGLVGIAGLLRIRHRRVTGLLVSASLVPVAAVAVAVVVSTEAMFISVHDSQVVLVALGAALPLSVALACVVGSWVVTGSHDLRRALRALGDDGVHTMTARPVPVELAVLSTELEATRGRLQASRLRERSLESSRRDLVAFLSHDLRSPLAGLRALAEGLEDGVVEDTPAALAQIRLSTDRLDRLVGDLFELSRLQGSGAPAPRCLVSLREVAEDVVGELHEHARSAGVDLTLDVAGDERLPVIGSADELARVLSNIVANAVRHTRTGAAVQVVGARGEDGRVCLAVQDGCGGIPPEDLGRVFDVGWRADPQRTPGDGRSGLGLAIARGVVERHEGHLLVANVPGGCRFEVALPGAPRPGAGAEATQPGSAPQG